MAICAEKSLAMRYVGYTGRATVMRQTLTAKEEHYLGRAKQMWATKKTKARFKKLNPAFGFNITIKTYSCKLITIRALLLAKDETYGEIHADGA